MSPTQDSETRRELIEIAFEGIRSMVNRLFIGLFVVLIVIVGALLLLRFLEVDGDGRRSAENLADILSESVAIRLGAVDGALTEIAVGNHRIGGPEGPKREWGELLRSAQLGVSGLSSLIVLGVDGVVMHSTLGLIDGTSWADRPVFQELAKGRPNQLFIDLPISVVVGSSVLIPFGRALTNPRGRFIGAAVATLLPNQLQKFLATFDLGESGVAWVLLPTGEVLFRQGASAGGDDAPSASEPPVFARDGAITEDGFIKGALTEGGSKYLTAYRKSGIGDLVVAVSLADSGFVGRWRYEALGGLILIVLAGAFLFLAARRIKAAVFDALESAPGDETADEEQPSPSTT